MATTKTALIALLFVVTACKSPQPPTVKVVGLWPEQPALSYKPQGFWTAGNFYIWPVLDSQPTLRWETFPRPGDTNGFTAVSYDLQIWRKEEGFPVELVYTRDALLDPSHQVERPLKRNEEYFWSVRARFQHHGQPRVTEWSRIVSPLPPDVPASGADCIYPDARYYRFRVR